MPIKAGPIARAAARAIATTCVRTWESHMPAPASGRRALLACLLLVSSLSTPLAGQPAPARLPFPLTVVDDGVAGLRLEANPVVLRELVDRRQVILDAVPLPDGAERSVTLRRVDVFRRGAVIDVDGARRRPGDVIGDLTLWSGEVVGEADSFVYFAFSSSGSRGVLRRPSGVSRLSADPVTGASMMTSVEAGEAPGLVATCQSSMIEQPFVDGPLDGDAPPIAAMSGSTYECNIAVETDYQFYQLFNDTTAATEYATALLGAVSSFYQSEVGCVITVPYLGIHSSSSDGWSSQDSGGGASALLSEFRAAWKDGNAPVSADLYHFVSGADLGGGVAYLDVLCSQSFGFGVSGNIDGGLDLPVDKGSDTWDFVVVAHELGHNFSSSHTHDFCPPLDECAPSGFFGACQSSQTCVSDGTVMSYCHVCSPGMSNIDIRFHETVQGVIRTAIEASCLDEIVLTGALCLVTSDSVSTAATFGGSAPDAVTVTFDNCGEAEDLNWTAELLDPVSWVSLSSSAGTITTTAADVDLTFDQNGVGTGTHSTTLRIINADDLSDFTDVAIELVVDPIAFDVGDQVDGTLASGDDVDRGCFEGVKGMKFKSDVTIGELDPALKIAVFDPNGDKIATWKIPSGTTEKNKVELPRDGTYSIKVVSKSGEDSGDYSVVTSASLPPSAETKEKTLKPDGKTFADLKFRVLKGATFSATVTPNAKVEGPLTLSLFDPNGDEVDISAFVTDLTVTDAPLSMTGKYRLRVNGFAGKKKEKAAIVLTPTQPLGSKSVTID